MTRKSVVLLLVPLIVLASCARKPESITPERKPLLIAVYASGELEPEQVYRSFATVSGIVQEVFVDEGDTIGVDQPLLRIRSENSDLNTANARLALELAQQNAGAGSPVLQELLVQVQSAKDKLQNDSLNFERFKRIANKGASYPAELERYQLAYESSRKNVQMAQKRVESTRIRLQNEESRARNLLASSSVTSKDFIVYSYLDGTVFGVYKKPGELVMLQEPVALIGSSGRYISKLTIDELDISKVKKGQEVLISIDTYGNKVFKGRITKIYPQPDQRTQAFRIDAEFTDSMPVLYPGLTLEANIIIAEKEDVLTIPMEYLKDGRFVMTADGELVEVETGETDNRYIEIISGIDENTEIIIPVTE
jgi:multidrug efflux pump subunit AcrA (membrane-fusion protein)